MVRGSSGSFRPRGVGAASASADGTDDGDGSAMEGGGIDTNALAANLGLDLVALSEKGDVICKRCHRLQNFGEVDRRLRGRFGICSIPLDGGGSRRRRRQR